MKFIHRFLNRIPYAVYFTLLFLFFPSPVYATLCVDAKDFSCLNLIYGNVLGYIVSGASIGFFIMILSGGLKWLTSSGDPKDIENAKGRITFAVFGLVLIILSWLILNFINKVTFTTGISSPILQFDIPH